MHYLSKLRNTFLIKKLVCNQNFLQTTTKRSFRPKQSSNLDGMKLAPKPDAGALRENNLVPGLLKCGLFTVGFCGTVFVGASIWHYENIKKTYMNGPLSFWVKTEWNKAEGYDHKEGNFRKSMNLWWNNLPEGKKIFWAICALNVLVCACWHHPALKRTMLTYFCSTPAARAVCWPMLLSTFSHYSLLHLGMNMYVLHSFSNAVSSTLGAEQFVGLYLAGGVIASFASQTLKVATRSFGPSLGASGAIMALLGYFCTQYPGAQLGIVFLPQFPFSAETAIKCVMCLDAAGIIFRWKYFDHAAHLGGALFGVLYAKIGQSHIWSKKDIVTKKWELITNKYSDWRKDK